MKRGYQQNFSQKAKYASKLFDNELRKNKAKTMVKVLNDALNKTTNNLSVLNVGGSAGIIDEYLSRYFSNVIGMDIDNQAIIFAKNNFQKENLLFEVGDAMNMKYRNNFFDIIVCSQVYEHVEDASKMLKEIYRVLKPNGIVYFAAGNRLVFNEPHYDLPLLSVIPRPMAHLYLKLLKKGSYYYEKHFTYWGLKKLVSQFKIIEYTKKIIESPELYSAEYMIPPNTRKQKLAKFVVNKFIWLMPGYIWVLKKKL